MAGMAPEQRRAFRKVNSRRQVLPTMGGSNVDGDEIMCAVNKHNEEEEVEKLSLLIRSTPRGSNIIKYLALRRVLTASLTCAAFLAISLFATNTLGSFGNQRTQSSSMGDFSFSSGVVEYDEAYKAALAEMSANIVDGKFIAGNAWTQLWTRDTSYAVELGAGLVHPNVSFQSLRACIETDKEIGRVWLQDKCGHFGGWPNLSDAIVGAQGAWSLYLVTGDKDFLREAYDVTKNSLTRGERDVYDVESGLFRGCSSFMESNSGYPRRYRSKGSLVGQTKALSTNMLYYTGYKLGAVMAKELQEPVSLRDELEAKAASLRDAIRSRLWLTEQGYYSYFEDENLTTQEQMEGLGESLVLLAPDFELDPHRIESIFRSTYISERGLPSLWPRFDLTGSGTDTANYYHNGRIWPFVQSYWAIAAARHGHETVFQDEFANLLLLGMENSSNVTFAEFYELDGAYQQRRRRQLWSDAGFLGMVYYGLFGMQLQVNGIRFHPIKPPTAGFAHRISLLNVNYRNMILDVHVYGVGSHIRSFEIDGKKCDDSFLPSNLEGRHTLKIILDKS